MVDGIDTSLSIVAASLRSAVGKQRPHAAVGGEVETAAVDQIAIGEIEQSRVEFACDQHLADIAAGGNLMHGHARRGLEAGRAAVAPVGDALHEEFHLMGMYVE